MKSTKPILLWCVYGKQSYLREAMFSLLSAQREIRRGENAARTVVLTDQPEVFGDWVGDEGEVHQIAPADFEDWRGPCDYLYRIKIQALRKTLAEHRVPVLLVDGDTHFTRDPSILLARLRPGRTVMDRPDGLIFSTPKHAAFAADLLEACPDRLLPTGNGRSVPIEAASSRMWVAGSAGVHQDDASVVDEVLAACDALYARLPAFNVEQYSFSEVFAARTEIQPSSDTIAHYWGDWVDPEIGHGRRSWATHQFDPILDAAEGQPLTRALEIFGDTRVTPLKRNLVQRLRGFLRNKAQQIAQVKAG